MTRVALAVVGAGVGVVLLVAGWDAITTSRGSAQPPDAPRPEQQAQQPQRLNEASGVATRTAATVSPAPRRAATPASAPPATPANPATPATPAAPLEPAIAEGRRELADSMFAVREGAEVTVHFDTDSLRTRFDFKFDGIVRATLPTVFGPAIGVALDSIPVGTLASGGDLLNDLPTRGIPIRVGSATLTVWPITRQGRDGPLVVAYRAAVNR